MAGKEEWTAGARSGREARRTVAGAKRQTRRRGKGREGMGRNLR